MRSNAPALPYTSLQTFPPTLSLGSPWLWQELEEDADMRTRVAIYKDPLAAAPAAGAGSEMGDAESDGGDLPKVR